MANPNMPSNELDAQLEADLTAELGKLEQAMSQVTVETMTADQGQKEMAVIAPKAVDEEKMAAEMQSSAAGMDVQMDMAA